MSHHWQEFIPSHTTVKAIRYTGTNQQELLEFCPELRFAVRGGAEAVPWDQGQPILETGHMEGPQFLWVGSYLVNTGYTYRIVPEHIFWAVYKRYEPGGDRGRLPSSLEILSKGKEHYP